MSTLTRARSASPPRSNRDVVPGKRVGPYNRVSPNMFLVEDPGMIKPGFTMCLEPGCMRSSRVAEFPCMTMRSGLSYCLDHVRMDEVSKRSAKMINPSNVTLIFYDIELSVDGQIEQIGARSESGKSFSAMIKTPTRNNTSPILNKIPSEIWNMCASEPKHAMERFNNWAMMVHNTETKGNSNPGDIMLAAHYGSCHDHVHMLKTMMRWGITPPPYRLSDTLAIFKTTRGVRENAKLGTLVNKYVPWIEHVAHDADSDASVLRMVIMTAFANPKVACYSFSISYYKFISRTGLDMYTPSPIATFMYSPTERSMIRRPSSAMSNNSIATRSSI